MKDNTRARRTCWHDKPVWLPQESHHTLDKATIGGSLLPVVFFFLFFFSSRSGPLSLMTALFLCSLTCVSFSASRFRDVNRDGVVCFASPKKIKVPSQFRARYERHSRVKMACPLPYATTREGAEFSRQQVWRCVGLSRARITICRLFCHP